MHGLQRAISLLYPDQCMLCQDLVSGDGGLCSDCWSGMSFVRGLACDCCGAPLYGVDDGPAHCDECIVTPKPWNKGRSVFLYRETGRSLILKLKHGDRSDLAAPFSVWMEKAAAPILRSDTLIVPVPLHWRRLLKRRYNQSAELAAALARRTAAEYVPDALTRSRFTRSQDGLDRRGRYANLEDAIVPHRQRGSVLAGRSVCLIDDVMTSGATLSAATHACYSAGAKRVSVLVLARVDRAPYISH